MSHSLFYTDSAGKRIQIEFQNQAYNNLMEFVMDQGLEEWGDCRGRAWCGTCHIQLATKRRLPLPDEDEQHRLSLLTNTTINSRLACQIQLDKNFDKAEIIYVGDD